MAARGCSEPPKKDLGRDDVPLIPAPAPPATSDWVVMEGTYGDRRHREANLQDGLAAVALESLGAAIEADLRLEARIPSYRESVDLA